MRAGRRALNRTRYRATGRRAEKKQISVRMRLPLAARMCTVRFATPKTKKKTEIIKTRNRAGYVAQTGEKKRDKKKQGKGSPDCRFPEGGRHTLGGAGASRFAAFYEFSPLRREPIPLTLLGRKRKNDRSKQEPRPQPRYIYTREAYTFAFLSNTG